MKTSKWLLTSSLAAIIAFTSLSVFASAESPQKGELPEAKQEMYEQKEAMKAAIEAGDYNAFAAQAPEQMLEQINADNFGRFVEMHNHLKQARLISDELGLKKPMQKGEMNAKMNENREEIRAAVESGDYQTWANLQREDSPILEVINEGNFNLLQKLHAAVQAEDFETAKEIKDELGLPDRPQNKSQGNPKFQRQQ